MTDILIRTFIAVAEHGQIAGAAESLSVSSAALSRQISLFENEVGVICFERSPRGMTLTPGGKILYCYFKKEKRNTR